MLNWIGRIILLAVAACFIGFTIVPFINNIQALNAIGWNYNAEFGSLLYAVFIVNGLTLLAAIPAAIAGLTGKGGFWLFLVSVVLIGGMVYLCILYAQNGLFADWQSILEVVKGFALPIAYVVGNILIMVSKGKK